MAKKLNKVGVLVGNCRGFVGNRMIHCYLREAQFLVEEGAAPEAVDTALYDFGMAMGPLAMGDLAGLDVGWRIRKEYKHLEEPGVRQPLVADALCEMGRYGQKTGAGWYRYDENRKPTPDPEVTALDREAGAGGRHRAPRDRSRRNRGAHHLRPGERRREDSGRGIRPAGGGYRHDLLNRLRIPGLSRRPHVVCRHGRV